jgi:cephalosporin hydroxylase
VKRAAEGKANVLIILDGDHQCNHVLDELRLYSTLVRLGGFVIVEDTNINGHPTLPTYGPGPWEAVDLFLAEN